MQSVEEKGFCFTALDGGLADLSIAITGLSDGVDEAGLGAAIERIVRASGAGVRVRHHQNGPSPDPRNATIPRLEAPASTGLASMPHTVTRIRSFDPLVSTRLRSLDIALVSGPADEADGGLPLRPVEPAVTRADGVSAGQLDAACRYATLFGRRRVQILVDQAGGGTGGIDDVDALGDIAAGYPDLELETVLAREALSSLVSGKTDLDVVVASPLIAELISATASILAGVPGLVTVLGSEDGRLVAGPHGEAGGPGRRQSGDGLPSVYVLSLVDLLIAIGRTEAARQIINGWCRTLEHGCHTPEFELARPYARCLDVHELADAVVERLDAQPRVLLPLNCGANPQPADRRRRVALRLVHSRKA